MRSISLVLILIIPLFIFSQDKGNCNGLKYGSFELYENGKKIGNVFRKDNLQIEKYFDKDTYTFVKIKPKNNCEFYFNALLFPRYFYKNLSHLRELNDNQIVKSLILIVKNLNYTTVVTNTFLTAIGFEGFVSFCVL